ncbi:TIGR03013 family XrtA/PEP-CTERM system glycosyltransferase [Rhodoferax sp. PAMC 29310]|uniref:TIGR03013 family XrtA/PEP-CTERM system glycosyltransferase n=1 Tax=Rhodoferax sp. PAMC 29310 TaxID=2822760 RepID=UPI001B320E62|nr:TIGR03013 family XrtA/PEP-CTERM system glycosyltransferase [Rhodoferax sp. PAMC 29310]
MLVIATLIIAIVRNISDLESVYLSVLIASLLLGFGIFVINTGLGFYQRTNGRTWLQAAARGSVSFFLSIPLVYGVFRLSPVKVENGKDFLLVLMLGIGIMLLNRVYANHGTSLSHMRRRVMIFGAGPRAKQAGKILLAADPNVDLVGYYASPNDVLEEVSAWGVLAPKMTLTDMVRKEKVDEIVVAVSERRGGSMPLRELLDCKLQGVHVIDLSTHFEKTLGQIRLDAVNAGWLVFSDGFAQGWIRSLVKRVFDIVCAAVLILLTIPVMLVTAVLIRMESRGPIFYIQERVGLRGQLFNVIKFRSMRTDAEKDGKPVWAAASDDRTTRVGRVIRKSRIDELPQLFNVLGGSMSLVGPRPERPYFVEKLTNEIPYFAVRHSIKPGLTGWAQVRYRYGASVEDSAEKLQYYLYYVKNHSLLLDLVVIFETVGVVLMGWGAH